MMFALVVATVALGAALILAIACALLEIDDTRRSAMEYLRRDGGR